MPKIKFKINNQVIETKEGKTILEAAKKNDIYVPSLCSHTDLSIKPNCRVCSVEIRGQKKLVTACSTPAKEGIEVKLFDCPWNQEKIRSAKINRVYCWEDAVGSLTIPYTKR